MSNRTSVFSAVSDERVYQDRKWGTIEDRPKQVGAWLTLMRYLLTEAERKWSTTDNDIGALDQVRKVVATGVACMEQHGIVFRSAADYAALSNEFSVSRRSDSISS